MRCQIIATINTEIEVNYRLHWFSGEQSYSRHHRRYRGTAARRRRTMCTAVDLEYTKQVHLTFTRIIGQVSVARVADIISPRHHQYALATDEQINRQTK